MCLFISLTEKKRRCSVLYHALEAEKKREEVGLKKKRGDESETRQPVN
jgi:hypothetical protein